MSEWTKEFIEKLIQTLAEMDAGLNKESSISALDEIERLQSENAKLQEELDAIKNADRRDGVLATNLYLKNQKLRSQRDRLIEEGDYIANCLTNYVGTLDHSWRALVDEITAED